MRVAGDIGDQHHNLEEHLSSLGMRSVHHSMQSNGETATFGKGKEPGDFIHTHIRRTDKAHPPGVECIFRGMEEQAMHSMYEQSISKGKIMLLKRIPSGWMRRWRRPIITSPVPGRVRVSPYNLGDHKED